MISETKNKKTSLSILVIDDDKIDFTLFYKKIEKIPHYDIKIDHIEKYDDAKKAILKSTHDVYFIDYTLGAQSGLELVEDVTDLGHKGPFIMLTGMDRPDLYQRSSETGVYDYLLKKELSTSQIQKTLTYTLERKKIENALNEERIFSDTIVKEVPYMVITIDSDGIIHAVNPHVKKVTSYEQDEVIGKVWHSFIEGMDTSEMSGSIDDNNTMSFTNTMVCKNGIKKTIEWFVLNNTWRNGLVSMTGKDITEKLEVEEKRRQGEKMKALGHLAGGVAHEINNLLQPILLNAEWIKDCDDLNEAQDTANDIIQTTVIASSIVEDILIFARQDQTKLEELPFLDNFNSALKISSEMIPAKINIDVENNCITDEIKCLFRAKDLVRVLSNLLKNSAYAVNNEGTINITLDEITNPKNTYVQITISDRGTGISDTVLENIFNPFYTTKDVNEGTGLGLTMVYNLIDNWGGTIKVKTEVDIGTAFIFTIPIYNKD